MKQCTLSLQHKWKFDRNIATSSDNGRVISMAVRGRYTCACGEVRIGAMNHNAPGADLRDYIGGPS